MHVCHECYCRVKPVGMASAGTQHQNHCEVYGSAMSHLWHVPQDHILSTYDRAISNFTQTEFGRSGITCVLNTRVASISRGEVTLVNACVLAIRMQSTASCRALS